MPEESVEGNDGRSHDDAPREHRRREQRLWRGGLIAALVFLGLATLYNGIEYRRLARTQQKLTLALIHKINERRHLGVYGPGFGGPPFPPPFPGVSPNYGPSWGWNPWYQGQQEQQQRRVPGGQSTPGQ